MPKGKQRIRFSRGVRQPLENVSSGPVVLLGLLSRGFLLTVPHLHQQVPFGNHVAECIGGGIGGMVEPKGIGKLTPL